MKTLHFQYSGLLHQGGTIHDPISRAARYAPLLQPDRKKGEIPFFFIISPQNLPVNEKTKHHQKGH